MGGSEHAGPVKEFLALICAGQLARLGKRAVSGRYRVVDLELHHPGVGLPGQWEEYVDHSSYALEVLPVNWFGLALILVAFLFLVLDLHVTNHGLPTVGGLVALVLGVLLLFDVTGPYLWILLVIVMAVAVLIGVFFMGALREVLAAKEEPATTGTEGMIGEVGVVKEPVGTGFPGWVFVHGEWWQAVAAVAPEDAHKQDHGQVIGVGRRVQVVGFRDGKVAVVPLEPAALEHQSGS